LIAVLTDPAVGGTFVTWSLHYLAGHDTYFSAKKQAWIDVPADPLTAINSHNFQANQPLTADEFDQTFDRLLATPTDRFHTLYLHNFMHNTESVDPDLAVRIQKISAHNSGMVVVSNSTDMNLYRAGYESRSGSANLWNRPDQVSTDSQEIFNDFVAHFFQDSQQKWNQLDLDNVWDQREFIALNFDFAHTPRIVPNIDTGISCYHLDTQDLFNTFDSTVRHLFEYLALSIDPQRWTTWQTVYQQWRQQHLKRLQFVWYFDTIVDAVVHGRHIDLTRFELDLVQEAAIQQTLIRKHNLNLKTWQLERFSNTQQLHDLLETNIHN